MWVLALLYFIAYAMFPGTNGTPKCEMRATEFCPKMEIEFRIPGNEEELNVLCQAVIPRLDCLHNHDVSCPSNRSKIFGDEYQEIRSLIGDICDKNSLLHEIISENLQCFKTNVEEFEKNCFDGRVKLRKAYNREREPQNLQSLEDAVDFDSEIFEESFEERALYRCLDSYFTASCLMGRIGETCGAMAKSAALDMLRRSKIDKTEDFFCAAEKRDKALEIIDDIELSSDIRNRMKEFIALTADWD